LLFGAEYASTGISTVRRTYTLPDVAIVNGRASAPETAIPAVTSPGFDRRITSDTLSVYAQEQADIADIVKLRGGIRVDSVKLVDDGTVIATRRRIAGSADLVSWQVGAVIKPAQWVSLYSGYARGRFIAVNTEATALSPIPESSSQIEAGIKTNWFGGKLNANIAAFETRRDDFFVTLVPGADPVQVGAQTSRGIELDIIGNPVKGLSIVANAAYIDARNRSSALSSITGIATNVPTLGKRLASTPEWSGSVWATYVLPDGPLAGLTLGGGATYKGAVFTDSLELLRVPAYTLFGAAIGYRTRHFDVQVNVENIGDARYYNVPTFIGAQPGTPRSVSLTVRAHL
jgi:iron complex outermembrane recepter protein